MVHRRRNVDRTLVLPIVLALVALALVALAPLTILPPPYLIRVTVAAVTPMIPPLRAFAVPVAFS